MTHSIAEARTLFAPTGTYLDSATYGLPPAPVRERLAEVLGEWRDGTGDWVEWSGAAERARATFARLVGVGPRGRGHRGPRCPSSSGSSRPRCPTARRC